MKFAAASLCLSVAYGFGVSQEQERSFFLDVSGAQECISEPLLPAGERVMITEDGVEFVRTPAERFENLSGWPFQPNYLDIDGLQMHYVDEGPKDGEVVLLLHGEPTWGYLYRKMIPVLVEAGYRVVVPDLMGLGRSDKPIDPETYSYEQHTIWLTKFIESEEVGMKDITGFVQDWGSLIGLRILGQRPELFKRMVVANGDLPVMPSTSPLTYSGVKLSCDAPNPYTREFYMENLDGVQGMQFFLTWFNAFSKYVGTNPTAKASDAIQSHTTYELTEDELAAYDAPYPTVLYKTGSRVFPTIVAGLTTENAQYIPALEKWQGPFLWLGGELDIFSFGTLSNRDKWVNRMPGAAGQDHHQYPDASHFFQEDVGVDMANRVVRFMEKE